MSAQPWMKFYPRDWRGDQALGSVSAEARCVWIECICIMHEAEPYGHLLLNGAPIPLAKLARMVRLPVEVVERSLAELMEAGVSSVTRAGIVFSRRMVRDAKGRGRSPIPRKMRQRILDRDKHLCRYCGEGGDHMQVDHVRPVSRGGKTSPRNLVVACISCNQAKGSKLLSEWKI